MSDAPLARTCDEDSVVQVFKWVVAGNSETDIREALAEKFPGSDPVKCLTAVMVRLKSSGDADRDVVFGWCVESTRDLYRRMVEIGDFANALRAVKQMSDLVNKHVSNEPEETEKEAARRKAKARRLRGKKAKGSRAKRSRKPGGEGVRAPAESEGSTEAG